jgi:PncC family amidohydrolase
MLVKNIQQLFIKNNWTLSIAESCTGGELSASITRVSGCSAYFLGSFIAYSNDLKAKILKIDSEVLLQKGAVSKEVVGQMAEGMLHLTGSDYCIAVSGIAGPEGGTPEKPVGTIWGAIACKNKQAVIWQFHLSGNREEIINQTVQVLLEKLWLLIN